MKRGMTDLDTDGQHERRMELKIIADDHTQICESGFVSSHGTWIIHYDSLKGIGTFVAARFCQHDLIVLWYVDFASHFSETSDAVIHESPSRATRPLDECRAFTDTVRETHKLQVCSPQPVDSKDLESILECYSRQFGQIIEGLGSNYSQGSRKRDGC
jgi:hypothetical protein